MRDYLSQIAKTAGNAVAHPVAARTVLTKRSAHIVAAFFMVLVAAFATLRVVEAQNTDTATTHHDVVTNTTIDSSTKDGLAPVNETPQTVVEGGQQAMTTPNSENQSSSSSTQTNVTVNGQKVDVPQNGSVSKTIQSDDGSTTVNITNSSTSTNGGSSTSNSLNVSTYSQSAGTNATQINKYMR